MAQHAVLRTKDPTPVTPRSRPEPRERLNASPEEIVRWLLSGDTQQTQKAAHVLGWESDRSNGLQIHSVRLHATNLDDDEDLEYVLGIDIGGRMTAAVVFDRSDESWWRIGEFTYHWHWSGSYAARQVEFGSFSNYDGQDLIIRERAGGTDVATTQTSLYRMHDTRLYRIFRFTEESWSVMMDIAEAGSEVQVRRTLYSVDDTGSKPRTIALAQTKRVAAARANTKPSLSRSCQIYRWDAETLSFRRDAESDARLCALAPWTNP